MELTRRDALTALAVSGLSGVGTLGSSGPAPGDGEVDAHVRETMVAVARIVYPSAVSSEAEFVETYLRGLASDRPDRLAGIRETVAGVDEHAESWYDATYRGLDADRQERLLRELGGDTADADPDGSTAERVRYYVVNELLFALYASPTGGELVGVENPQGHPGGLDSYQRGPDR